MWYSVCNYRENSRSVVYGYVGWYALVWQIVAIELTQICGIGTNMCHFNDSRYLRIVISLNTEFITNGNAKVKLAKDNKQGWEINKTREHKINGTQSAISLITIALLSTVPLN